MGIKEARGLGGVVELELKLELELDSDEMILFFTSYIHLNMIDL